MDVISFVNMKGGVGKTTLAVNVADALSRRHEKRVLLIDLDPQFNATQCLYSGEEYVRKREAGEHTIVDIFNENPGPSISPVKGEVTKTPTKLEDVTPWSYKDRFDVIPGDLEVYRIEMGSGQGKELRLKRYLEKLAKKNKYDFVIIDTPPTPSHYMSSALLASKYYIVPVKPEPLSRVGIDLLRAVIGRCSENHGHDIECIGVVLTLVDRRTKVYTDASNFLDRNRVWRDKRYKPDLPHRTAVARGQGEQSLILDLPGGADAKRALTSITSELLKRIENA
ncbi:ParA family protein [Saliniramus sp.]|uniref:ParA family protein n=1 Tax=Saliniramus sp. TaxID=2986772 RepID=UPI0039C9DDB6